MSAFYTEGLQFYLGGGAAFAGDASLKVALMAAAYTPSSADSNWNTISTNQLGASVALGSKSSAAGVATGGTATFTGIASGNTVGSVVLYHDLGAGAGTLICFWNAGTGFPLTTTGADIKVKWNGADPTGTMFSL